ncbi:MAG: hypothetical protein V1784_09575 [bacterium]
MTEMKNKELVLVVNGTEIKMNDFVKRIVTNILGGILDSLKLDEPAQNAVFTIAEKRGE